MVVTWDPHFLEFRVRVEKVEVSADGDGEEAGNNDPFVPIKLKDEYALRAGQLLTTEVIQKKSKNKKKGTQVQANEPRQK